MFHHSRGVKDHFPAKIEIVAAYGHQPAGHMGAKNIQRDGAENQNGTGGQFPGSGNLPLLPGLLQFSRRCLFCFFLTAVVFLSHQFNLSSSRAATNPSSMTTSKLDKNKERLTNITKNLKIMVNLKQTDSSFIYGATLLILY